MCEPSSNWRVGAVGGCSQWFASWGSAQVPARSAAGRHVSSKTEVGRRRRVDGRRHQHGQVIRFGICFWPNGLCRSRRSGRSGVLSEGVGGTCSSHPLTPRTLDSSWTLEGCARPSSRVAPGTTAQRDDVAELRGRGSLAPFPPPHASLRLAADGVVAATQPHPRSDARRRFGVGAVRGGRSQKTAP